MVDIFLSILIPNLVLITSQKQFLVI